MTSPTFAEMMALEPHGPDTFVGTGPRYPWGGLYGGQIVAQGLRAAGLTVEATYPPHSLHAYFIRPGDHDEPIRFEVDRDRNGRSFCTRRVVARQSVGVILNMACSFQVLEDTVDVQASTMRTVTGPDDIDDDSWSDLFDRHDLPTGDTGAGRSGAWLRLREDLGDDPLVSACALAYLSDDMPTEAVFALHPDLSHLRDLADGSAHGRVITASLDHAIWFHQHPRADAWQLHDFHCERLIGSWGLARGSIFTDDGTHVADVDQQVLLRLRT